MKREVKLTSLFFIRFFLYFTVIILPLFHPAIVVPYDTTGWVFWFFLIPCQMFLAFFLAPPRMTLKSWFLSAVIVSGLISLFTAGFSVQALAFTLGGLLSFAATALLFKTKGRVKFFTILELFYFGIIYFRLLSFSRASEDIAEAGHGFTQIIMAVAVCTFCVHALIIYLAAFSEQFAEKKHKELGIFVGLSVWLILFIVVILPPDFISHSIVLNELAEEPELKPLGEHGYEKEGGSVPRNGGEQRGGNRLEGVPRDRWNTLTKKHNKQYATMLVITKADPLYAAGMYLSEFDPVRGFVTSRDASMEDSVLNSLKYKHLLQTWKWPAQDSSKEIRKPVGVRSFSIKPERFVAYMPLSIEPTTLTQDAQPFRYGSYSISGLTQVSPGMLLEIPDLTESQKQELAPYLALDLTEPVKQDLERLVGDIKRRNVGPYVRAMLLLQTFSIYRYEIGITDDMSVEAVILFLFETYSGDCSEFSHAYTLLARLLGIPARVVTGYLATKKLQTPAHRQGVLLLKKELAILDDYSAHDIYLVTTSHRHSWAQIFLPVYGWIDVETTQFAIPPPMGQDPNDWQVVIPYDEGIYPVRDASLGDPLVILLRIFTVISLIFVIIVISIYVYRFYLIAYYTIRSRKNDTRGLHTLYILLLMRLAFRGYTLKKPHQTIQEYADHYPELKKFARAYTTLRYRSTIEQEPAEEFWRLVREAYDDIIQYSKKQSAGSTLKSWFSLRGLFYQW
jgi:transglutaminase-like putative cysteine protease